MFSTSSNQVSASRPFKRKGEFATDKQAWPETFYKRPCETQVGRDARDVIFSSLVRGAQQHDRWIAMPGWDDPRCRSRSTPMQRIVARSPSPQARAESPPEPVVHRNVAPGQGARPPARWGDFGMFEGEDGRAWPEAGDPSPLESLAEYVPVKQVGLLKLRA